MAESRDNHSKQNQFPLKFVAGMDGELPPKEIGYWFKNGYSKIVIHFSRKFVTKT